MHTNWTLLQERTKLLERWIRILIATWVLTAGILLVWAIGLPSNAQQSGDAARMRVSELVVVDKNGVERVRIGGELPDAIIGGKRVPRGQQAAGVLLYDSTGSERSGYVTFEPSGNVGLTLDSRKNQVASFVASGEADASAFSLWTGKNIIELRSDSEGARLTGVSDGTVLVQEPIIRIMSKEMCGAYKEALSRVSPTQVMSDCRRRFTDGACSACLAPK